MKGILFFLLAIALLWFVRSPKAESFVVPSGGAAVYKAPGDSLPAYLLTEGDTVALKLIDATYSTFRESDQTWYMKRSDLIPLHWMGKIEHVEQCWLNKISTHFVTLPKTDGKMLPFFFLGITLLGASILWLLRKRRNQSFVPYVAAPVLIMSAGIAVLQLTADDAIWFCHPSVVGWPLTIVNFALFAACTVAQVYLLRQTFRSCTATDRNNRFKPTFLLPLLAAIILVAVLLLYPFASMWVDIRILQHLLYGVPFLLLVVYALYTGCKFVLQVKCGILQKLVVLMAGVASLVTLTVLGIIAVSILFFVIFVIAAFFLLNNFAASKEPGKDSFEYQPGYKPSWHTCPNCPYADSVIIERKGSVETRKYYCRRWKCEKSFERCYF